MAAENPAGKGPLTDTSYFVSNPSGILMSLRFTLPFYHLVHSELQFWIFIVDMHLFDLFSSISCPAARVCIPYVTSF